MSLTRGTRLGPYEILAPLGAGGMGEVYRARDSKLDRDVAIKVLPESVASDPEALARFEREAKAVAALSHPNILSIFDYGSEGGVAYAVMELLEGQTLREKLEAGPIPIKQAVDYALQVAKGLSAAHERGIVHRDLKPDNLFVSRDGHLKILDFGLAKRVEEAAGAGGDRSGVDETSAPTSTGHGFATTTGEGTVMGTVGYMSPEQVRGRPVDARSDIFSFGSILYELLTGKRAFKRDTAGDTIAAILLQEPPEMAESGRQIPVALDHIVRHCLEKDRDRRFQSARDIVFALSEASDPLLATGASHAAFPLPLAPASVPAAGPLGIVPARRKMPGGISGIVIVVAILVVAVGLPLWRRAHPAAASSEATTSPSTAMRIAVLPFENLGPADDEYFADGIADEIRGKLTSVSGIEVIARASSMPYRKTAKTPEQIAKELGVGYLLTATVRWEKNASTNTNAAGRVHVTPELVEIRDSVAPTAKWRESFDAALTDVFQVQSDIAARVSQSLGIALRGGAAKQIQQRPTENLAAYDAYLRGRDALSRGGTTDPASLRKALVFYEQAVALDPGFAPAWAGISIASAGLYSNGTPTPELARRSREAAEKSIALAPDRVDGYLALGSYDRSVANDFPRAAEQYEKARRIVPGDSRILSSAAIVDQALGRWEESLEKLRRVLRVEPRSVQPRRSLGTSLLRLRRPAEARAELDQALLVAPTNIDTIEYKAMTYLQEGDLAGARAVLAAAPKEIETALVAQCANYYDLVWLLDDEHRNLLLRLTPTAFDDDRGQWATSLAQAYALRGDAANVKKYAEEAAKAFGENVQATPKDAGRRISHAVALALADGVAHKEEAIQEGLRAVALDPVSKDQIWGTYVQHQMARVYILVGEPEKALDQLEPLLKIPYYLSPKWLAIDPNFDPLRKNARFEKLVAARK